jgi:NADH-quinone oxidoreductase subunit H
VAEVTAVETAPLWSVLLLAPVLWSLALGAAGLDAVLGAALAGHPAPARQLLAPLREAAGLLVQQRRTTLAADVPLWRAGTAGVLVAAVLAAAVVPLGSYAVADLGVGVVWFNAMEVLVWGALWLAGWGCNAVYGLVGGYRFVAQGLAYELPHMFALITAALGARSLRVGDVVAAQSGLWFAAWMPVAFAVYLLSALAMAFWGPLAQPVARDIAGGVQVELAGVDRLVFLAGRYALLVVAAAFGAALFLGGGQGPLLPGWLWSLLKTLALVVVLVWARWRFPTIRMERFMELAWLLLIPATLVQMLVVGVVVLRS